MERNATSVRTISLLELAPYVRLVQHIQSNDRYRLPPRIIYDYELKFVVAGSCEYTIDQKLYKAGPGDMIFLSPMVKHSCIVPKDNRFHYYAVHFDLLYMGEAFDFSVEDVYLNWNYLQEAFIPVEPELTDRPIVRLSDIELPYVFSISDRHGCESLLRSMYAAFAEREFGAELLLRGELLNLLALIVRELTATGGKSLYHPRSERVGQAIRWMETHYRSPIQLHDIASSVHLSPSRFRELFKEETGKSPIEMLVAIRMKRAKDLLLHSSLSVGQIAEEVGYPDIHYFSRLFKRAEGLSPLHYAQSLRSKFR